MSPLLGVKEEAQSFFDLQKDSKHLSIEKKMEKAVFIAGPNKGCELSYVALCYTKYLKRVVKNVRPRKEKKGSDKTSTGKSLILFNPLHQPYANKSCNKNN